MPGQTLQSLDLSHLRKTVKSKNPFRNLIYMNKAFCRKRTIFSLLLTGCLILFNLSCGLDTFYVIESPDNSWHTPSWDNRFYESNHFDFYTKDKDYDSIKFLGTEVYYKIYKSSTRLNTEVNDLITLADKSDSSSAAAERMIQSYRYQPLRASGHEGDNILFPTTGSNQFISIRLSTYQLYPAEITIDRNDSIGIPVRYLERKPSFNFRAADTNTIPKSDDVDVNTSGSSSEENLWYVAMFAVAVGQDVNYSPIYSNILYLGSVQIPVE